MEPVRPGLPSGEAFPDSVYFILEDPTPQTRVIYADAIHSDFEKEDTVGCFALDADLNVISESTKNARYRVSVHTNVETGEDRRFLAPISDEDDLPRNDSYKYLFYYPYDKNVKELSDLQKYSHMILANQNQREKYEASDLLWDICAPDPTLHCVFVKMDHAMSNVIVEVEPSLIKEGTVPTLLGRPKGVRQLNLVRGSLEEMENNLDDVSYLLVDDTQDIIMWEFGRANSGNYMFRAIVPSNHVITPGTTILSIVNTKGVTKKYKTSMNMSKISFKPGRNYYLNVVEKHDYVAPEIGDDETWVYDVLDPETGQPVGLLCREYLHFQPGKETFDTDIPTGTPYSGTEGNSKYISSQAWVFYKLRASGEPNLDEGYVLRFVYDVVYAGDGLWPYPFEGIPKGGFFTPKHGHAWTRNIDGNDLWDAPGVWGTDSKDHEDYFMHSGKITWDGSNNKISWFTLPDAEITNEDAENNGHIAIPLNGDPYLCYNAITDEAPHKIGILSPHYLVDRRVGKQRGVEERLYPLVKIGYNQFWMSSDLRAATQVDGSALVNYNSSGPALDFPVNRGDMAAGYVFSFKETFDNDIPNKHSSYDPYNQLDASVREQHKVAPMYNFLVLEGAGMVPRSFYGVAEYCMPSWHDMESMHKYVGWGFNGKIATRGIRERKYANNRVWLESEWDAYLNGKYVDTRSSDNMHKYNANICGFDLRPEGVVNNGTMFQIGLRSGIMLLGGVNDPTAEYIYSWTHQDVTNPESGFVSLEGDTFIRVQTTIDTRPTYFAPLRFFLKFNGQADSGGISVSSLAKGARTKSPTAPVETRDVYIGVEAVDQVQD